MKLSQLFTLLFLFLFVIPVNISQFIVYRVVLDPGHGGIKSTNRHQDGDRFDMISKKYLSSYNSGATYKNIKEEEIAYEISLKVKKILLNCSVNGNFANFVEIAKKYTDDSIKRIRIETRISRDKSLSKGLLKKQNDPNGQFRLFDYYAGNKKIKGRISKINEYKPHMVVSIHMAHSGANEYQGLSPVLAAPYRILLSSLKYMKGENKNRDFFYNSKLKHWFVESTKRTAFNWMLNDTSLYFTGYALNSNGSIKKNFRGYRYNMISWAYADKKGWQDKATLHRSNTKYSKKYNNLKIDGKFWKRENSVFESYRRDYGTEGFGGDNSYAGYEIIRYILYSLKMDSKRFDNVFPGQPYVSVWSMPLHVNAINPYIELGYFNRKRDRYMLTKKQDEIAEGIAVGIYSLFAGLRIKSRNINEEPKGKKVDFEKYKIQNNTTYFDDVVN